jgi:hypothetical protein
MRLTRQVLTFVLLLAWLFPAASFAQSLTLAEIQARVLEYKTWLDQFGSNGLHFWTRLDSSKRPHRLYVGEAFLQADLNQKEQFVEIFSRYLAGHPEKNMLIDIFDAGTGRAIGEYGFGGFKLF